MATTVRLTGWTAIEAAERGELSLCKAADPTEGERKGLSVDEARAVAAEDPSLIYVERPQVTTGQLREALSEAGITGLKIEVYADGTGAVVNDGAYIWPCRPERLLAAAESLVEDGTAARMRERDGEDQAALYTELCRRARMTGSGEDMALREQIVVAWQEEHQAEGNWS